MEKQNNTGLGLIKTTIERVQNEKSLFNSALKKLVNSSEEELDGFLKMKLEKKDKSNILSLISVGQNLVLKALDGSRLIYKAKKTFKSHIDSDFVGWGLNKSGIATPETPIQVHEMTGDGTFINIFSSLSGNWNQKWLSQDQVIEFCETLPTWLRQDEYATMFLCKINENKPIFEDKPQDNLVVVCVCVFSDGLSVCVDRLEDDAVWRGEYRHRVVSPQLITLSA